MNLLNVCLYNDKYVEGGGFMGIMEKFKRFFFSPKTFARTTKIERSCSDN